MKLLTVIDPASLAMPEENSTADHILDCFERMTEWANCLTEASPWQLALPTQAPEVLFNSAQYPAFPKIQQLIRAAGLSEVVSVADVDRAINRILTRCKTLSDLQVREVLGFSDIMCEPDILSAYSDKTLGTAAGAVLLTLALNAADNPLLFGSLRACSHPMKVHVSSAGATIRLVDLSQIVEPLDSEVKIILSRRDTCKVVSAEQLWNNAADNFDLGLSILVAAEEIAARSTAEHEAHTYDFTVGRDFYRSVVQAEAGPHGNYAGTVREACARVVLRQPKYEVASLKKRDGTGRLIDVENNLAGVARRTHITKGDRGLRLMFWEKHNGFVEIANVENKVEAVIATSDPIEANWIW